MDKEAKLAEKAARKAEKEALEAQEKLQEAQKRAQAIFAHKIHLKPEDVHYCGLELIKKNHFVIGQEIDITWNINRFFAMEAEKKRFYFDPIAVKYSGKTVHFEIYFVEQIVNATIYNLTQGNTRAVGVQVILNNPAHPTIYIETMPYAAVNNALFLVRYKLAEQILVLLQDAVAQTRGTNSMNNTDTVQQKQTPEPKVLVCKGCGAPIGESDACDFCGAPLK
jgi:hypothetical protein